MTVSALTAKCAVNAYTIARAALIAVVLVLLSERYPESVWRFLCGIVRWEANVLAYLASLTDRYPPFALEADPVSPAASSS